MGVLCLDIPVKHHKGVQLMLCFAIPGEIHIPHDIKMY